VSERTTEWRIVEAPRPASLDNPDAWAYHGMAEVERACYVDLLGNDDLADPASVIYATTANQSWERTVRLVAVLPEDGSPGRVVGTAVVSMDQRDNLHWADLGVGVHPEYRRRGIGTALLSRVEELAIAGGRTQLLWGQEFPREPEPGEPGLDPATGVGRAPSDLPAASMARARGYRLEQVDRRSVLRLPVDPDLLERLVSESATMAAGYRTHTWVDEIPDEWLDGFAALETRMSVDAPHGEMDWQEEVWDAERVRERVEQHAAGGNRFVVTAAEEVATGRLAGMTLLLFPAEDWPYVYQDDTIVLAAHRGHRLGMLIKAVNLRELARLRPSARRVYTWNAQENAHMLAINVALGFWPAGGTASFRRVLPG
jgi:GNAT superfamily N-acetyltransferase